MQSTNISYHKINVFRFALQLLSEKFLILRTIKGLHVRYQLFLLDCNQS